MSTDNDKLSALLKAGVPTELAESLSTSEGAEPETDASKKRFASGRVQNITILGDYAHAGIRRVKAGEFVKVSVCGSAMDSEFYYSVVEVVGNAKPHLDNMQVIQQKGGEDWRSIATQGLFEVTTTGTVVFAVRFVKSDVSGAIKAWSLSLIVEVLGIPVV